MNSFAPPYSLQPMVDVPGFAWFKEYFTSEELDNIVDLVPDSDLTTARVRMGWDYQTKSQQDLIESPVRNSKIKFLNPSDPSQKWVFEKLTELVNHANDLYFRFDLDEIHLLQFTTYGVGEFYKLHADSGITSYNRYIKLSFSMQLSHPEDYEGGDLVVLHSHEKEIASRERGVIAFYPSNTLHEVTKVTKGVRKSLVGLVSGPRWR